MAGQKGIRVFIDICMLREHTAQQSMKILQLEGRDTAHKGMEIGLHVLWQPFLEKFVVYIVVFEVNGSDFAAGTRIMGMMQFSRCNKDDIATFELINAVLEQKTAGAGINIKDFIKVVVVIRLNRRMVSTFTPCDNDAIDFFSGTLSSDIHVFSPI